MIEETEKSIDELERLEYIKMVATTKNLIKYSLIFLASIIICISISLIAIFLITGIAGLTVFIANLLVFPLIILTSAFFIAEWGCCKYSLNQINKKDQEPERKIIKETVKKPHTKKLSKEERRRQVNENAKKMDKDDNDLCTKYGRTRKSSSYYYDHQCAIQKENDQRHKLPVFVKNPYNVDMTESDFEDDSIIDSNHEQSDFSVKENKEEVIHKHKGFMFFDDNNTEKTINNINNIHTKIVTTQNEMQGKLAAMMF